MTAAERIVHDLQEHGITWMSTLCGHGLDPLFHAARRAGMRLVDTRNEQAAAYVADAYARITGRLAVCAVSSGIAHVNALSGVANAHFAGSPLLLLSGAGAHQTAGMGHFQDMDQAAVAAPLTKYARVLDCAERASQILAEAVDAAVSYPTGPAHLTLPMDVQNTEVEQFVQPNTALRGFALGEDTDISDVQRPLIVAGSETFYSGLREYLLRFSAEHSIPLVTPIWDRGIVDQPIETYMGVVGAASGGPRLLPDADCIIMAGAAPDYRVGFLQQPTKIVWDWQRLRGARRYSDWLAEARRRRDEFRKSVEQTGARQAEQGTHAIHILEALREVLSDDAVLLIDGGSIGQWAHQLLCDTRYPSHWLTCGPSGVVGWGIAGAMGARLAYPQRPVVLLSGDGAFTFTVAELECAVRQRLPFVAIVADDQGWGITRTGHVRQFGEPIASSLGPIAFDRLAEALGARGVVVSRPEQIAAEIRRAIAEPQVTVIHIPVVGGNP